MAKILIGQDYGSYTFDKVAKTVSITLPFGNVKLEGLLMITDTTNNTIIYQFNDPTKGATLSGNVFTLTFNTNTGAFANTDKLQIFYYDEQPISQQMNDMAVALSQIFKSIQRPIYTEQGGNVLRTVARGGGLDFITTVNSITTLNGIGDYRPTELRYYQNNTYWEQAVRSKIS